MFKGKLTLRGMSPFAHVSAGMNQAVTAGVGSGVCKGEGASVGAGEGAEVGMPAITVMLNIVLADMALPSKSPKSSMHLLFVVVAKVSLLPPKFSSVYSVIWQPALKMSMLLIFFWISAFKVGKSPGVLSNGS